MSKTFLVELSGVRQYKGLNEKDDSLECIRERYIVCDVLSELGYDVENYQEENPLTEKEELLKGFLRNTIEKESLGIPTETLVRIIPNKMGLMVKFLY